MIKSSRRPKKTLKEPESFEHGYNYAIFLLGLSMRTVGEVEEKMKRRGYTETVIKEVLGKLLEQKYLNDEEYAEVYLRNFKEYQTYGLFMIKKKMKEKKLPDRLVESILENELSEDDEYQIAKRYTEKKISLHELRALPYEEKQKFMQRLLSRGFRFGVVTKLAK
jgi:regulatory protein